MPMRWIILLPAIYIVAVVETSLADVVRVGTVGPDLLALLAIAWVLLWGGPRGFLIAGLIGLVGDLLLPGRPGVGMALLLVIGYVTAQARFRLPMGHPVWQVAALGIGTMCYASGLAFFGWLLGETTVPLRDLFFRALGVGIYTAGVAAPLLLIVHWMDEPFQRRRRRLVPLQP